MQRSTRVNYDAIAERYDSTPHREKSADPEIIAFLAGRGPTANPAQRHGFSQSADLATAAVQSHCELEAMLRELQDVKARFATKVS